MILAFTGDEESGGWGIRTVISKRPELIDAGIALNEGGAPITGADGHVKMIRLQGAEKIYRDFTISAHGPTGHSSIPQKGNPLSIVCRRPWLNSENTNPRNASCRSRAHYYQAGLSDDPQMAKAMRALAAAKGKLPAWALNVIHQSPILSSPLSTTCVATMLEAGTKVNALPAEAHAMVQLPHLRLTKLGRTSACSPRKNHR